MKFLKTKKYSILSNFLKYSFVGVLIFISSFSILITNNFVKTVKASGESLSATNITSTSADLVGSGLKSGNYQLYLKIKQGSDVVTIMMDSDTIINGGFTQNLPELSPGLLYNAYIYYDNPNGTPIATTNFTTLTGAGGGTLSATSITSNSADLVGSGLKSGDYQLYLKIKQGNDVSTIMLNSSTFIDSGFIYNLDELSPGLLYNAYIYYDSAEGTPISTTSFTTLTGTVGGNLTTPTTGEVKFKGLVPICNTEVDTGSGGFKNPCDFNMLLAAVNRVINFLIITMATPLFALILVYVGWLYLSDMGSSENITKAKKIFKNVIIGYLIALAAWLIVKTLLTTLGFNPKDAFLIL